ncbi:hypothetical protein M0804_009918 [Polistes exclamans]|nr:hypothetical protein M0804_009918 [Polistes exclamans]
MVGSRLGWGCSSYYSTLNTTFRDILASWWYYHHLLQEWGGSGDITWLQPRHLTFPLPFTLHHFLVVRCRRFRRTTLVHSTLEFHIIQQCRRWMKNHRMLGQRD